MSPARTLRTLRHLRPSQIGFRLWYRARLPLFRRRWSPGEETGAVLLAPPVSWPGDAAEGERIRKGRIRLVGLEGGTGDWRAVDKPLLWRFTLHYFEWLPHLAVLGTTGAETARGLIGDWLTRFERFDAVAWHPYPLSLRLFAWLAHAPVVEAGAGTDFVTAFRRSLHRQARHLERVWERDVGGNHLIKNLKAELAAALCLPGHGGRLGPALERLELEIARQVLPDGCHYERSPSYHLQVLTDFEELAALFIAAGRPVPGFLADAVARMKPVAAFFRMGSGLLAQFNDGTVDGARQAGKVPSALPDAGYWRLSAGEALAVVDCGPCCPDDLPAHAHADTLSFEFSLGSNPVVVNGGTFAYQDPHWRNVFRGTPAHSTVAVDDGDSAEVYGAFRLGRRPHCFEAVGDGAGFEGAFDGWSRLGLIHRRGLTLTAAGLEGRDRLERKRGRGGRIMTARFLLHPSVTARLTEGGVALTLADGSGLDFTAEGGAVTLAPGLWSPRFHEKSETVCIRVDAPLDAGAGISWRFTRRAEPG